MAAQFSSLDAAIDRFLDGFICARQTLGKCAFFLHYSIRSCDLHDRLIPNTSHWLLRTTADMYTQISRMAGICISHMINHAWLFHVWRLDKLFSSSFSFFLLSFLSFCFFFFVSFLFVFEINHMMMWFFVWFHWLSLEDCSTWAGPDGNV